MPNELLTSPRRAGPSARVRSRVQPRRQRSPVQRSLCTLGSAPRIMAREAQNAESHDAATYPDGQNYQDYLQRRKRAPLKIRASTAGMVFLKVRLRRVPPNAAPKVVPGAKRVKPGMRDVSRVQNRSHGSMETSPCWIGNDMCGISSEWCDGTCSNPPRCIAPLATTMQQQRQFPTVVARR